MKKSTILFLLVSTMSFYSCKKDNDDTPKADATGYWKGYFEVLTTPRTYAIAFLNRPDGSSRLYAPTGSGDSALAGKADGRWQVINNNEYRATYYSVSDTIYFQAVMEGPYVRLTGLYSNATVAAGFPFDAFKVP